MATVTEPEEGVTHATGTVSTTRKSLWDHAWCLLKRWPSLVARGIAVVLAIAGASVFLVDAERLRDWRLWLLAVLVAVAVTVFMEARLYVRECPPGLEDESPQAQRVAHLQPCNWEFRLAELLLRARLGDLDRQLVDLQEGRAFVPHDPQLSVDMYNEWVQLRLHNLMRMGRVARLVVTTDLLAALMEPRDADGRIHCIRESANRVCAFYRATVEFDRAGHAVYPPDGWDTAHGYALQWTKAVRDGVQQQLSWLEAVANMDDLNKAGEITCMISFESPESVDQFMDEAHRLTDGLW